MNRRRFLRLAATVGAVAAGARGARAAGHAPTEVEFIGVLVDTTRCIGCRSCEVACGEAHGLDVPDVLHDGALERERTMTTRQRTVVNRYETEAGTTFVKRQCLHCWQPACTSACPTNAMYKTHEGPVIWREPKCMGCRYCMVACPFKVPRFEYDSPVPRIEKCTLCWERLERGLIPACVKACPVDALMFGSKRELLEIARVRIYNHPEHYVHKIYGEHEVGGTGWLYLSAVPFEQLGLPTDLGTTPYPEYSKEFLYSVPVVFLVVPTLLAGLHGLAAGRGRS
ncbi:MAG TPA: 4Fe-4S dicluster domain-containing protein [Candidatus Sulfomarinibacteraceae bacterium]|nr:4Fe-4S dicluster domain-containing protein [Candidatus Sulfomarinibacteraceae bacterium]